MVNISTLGRSLEQIDRINAQQSLFQDLSIQLGTGKRSQTFVGLGENDLTSIRARSSIRVLQSFNTNIATADRRIEGMIDNIEEFKVQAKNFADTLVTFAKTSDHQEGNIIYYDDPTTQAIEETPVGYDSSEIDTDFESLVDYADKLFDLLVDLLNKKDGDRFILTGAETLTQPFNDNGTLDAALSTLIDGWKDESISTTNFINDLKDRTTTGGNTDALTDTVIGYSSVLASGNAQDIFVRADNDTQVNYTALANEDGFRDVMIALAVFKNNSLPPIADAYTTNEFPASPNVNGAPGDTTTEMRENFFDVFSELQAMVVKAIDDLDSIQIGLEQSRVIINEVKNGHDQDIILLDETVAEVEDVDINEVAVRIQSLQITLEASYSVTSLLSQLSLTNFL